MVIAKIVACFALALIAWTAVFAVPAYYSSEKWEFWGSNVLKGCLALFAIFDDVALIGAMVIVLHVLLEIADHS